MTEDKEAHGNEQEHDCHGKAFGKDFKFKFKFDKLKDLKAMGKELREFIGQSLAGGRVNVIMVRVEDKVLEDIDTLLSAEIFKSRSEAAAFLISKGLESTEGLFGTIMEKTAKIEELRAEIRDVLGMDAEEEEEKAPEPQADAEKEE